MDENGFYDTNFLRCFYLLLFIFLLNALIQYNYIATLFQIHIYMNLV